MKKGSKAFCVKETAHTKNRILWENLEHLCMAGVQAYLRDIVDLVPNHHNRVCITIKSVAQIVLVSQCI